MATVLLMADYEQQVEVGTSPEEATHRLYGVLGSLKGAGPPRVDGAWVTTSVGASAWSWGETVSAYVQPGQGRCLITMRSKSAFALIDWGKNKKNVETALERLFQPAPQQGPPQQGPHQQGPPPAPNSW